MKSPINAFFDKVYVISLPIAIKNRMRISRDLGKLNVKFEFFDAIDGNSSQFDREWESYISRPLATKPEEELAKKLVNSRGAWGCLYSYKFLIQKIIQCNHESTLILEDDCIFTNNFNEKFVDLIKQISEDWKLIMLGASQYGWDQEDLQKKKFYRPASMKTKGAFAVGYRKNTLDEILIELGTMQSAYDHFPLGNIYEKYKQQCYVAFPNLVIADVRTSNIRDERDLVEHSKKMKWRLEDFIIHE